MGTNIVSKADNRQPVTGLEVAPVAVGNDAVGLATLDDSTKIVLITLEGDVRMTYDGSDPVNTGGSEHGAPFYSGAVFEENARTAAAMKFCALEVDGSATLWVQEFTR